MFEAGSEERWDAVKGYEWLARQKGEKDVPDNGNVAPHQALAQGHLFASLCQHRPSACLRAGRRAVPDVDC